MGKEKAAMRTHTAMPVRNKTMQTREDSPRNRSGAPR